MLDANELEGQKARLLELLQSSYDRFAWHGPNLTQALAGDRALTDWPGCPARCPGVPYRVDET